MNLAIPLFSENAPYISAPFLNDEAQITGLENELIWAYGKLVPDRNLSPLKSPLSMTECLHYYYDKRQGSWETDSDGDRYRVWTVIESESRTVNCLLQTGRHEIPLSTDGVHFHSLEPAADFEKSNDKIDFNYREFIIPMENKVWVLGKLENLRIVSANRGLFIGLGTPESIIAEFQDQPVAFFFLFVLCIITGTGCFSVFALLLLPERPDFLRPLQVIMGFLALALFWIFSAIMVGVFHNENSLPEIISIFSVTLAAGGLIIPPLAAAGCKPAALPALCFFPAAFLSAILGSWLFYQAFFTLVDPVLPLAAGFLCVITSTCLILVYRLVFARQD
ncbi:MAG: hypothetical protein JW904_10445 [Spirochaetales bacterium]|nr:hypothetical protein [Spirochaetales bacterium]